MRYGMNPHQTARIVGGADAVTVVNGEPSMINLLDALNAFALVREADAATGLGAAASFKHVSPAGAAVAGEIDETAARLWRIDGGNCPALLSAYVRARDADPKSSFGDVVALSRPVDIVTAEFLTSVICDAVIAPGFDSGVAELLSSKKRGRFLVLECDPDRPLPAIERREILGVTIEQERDSVPVASVLADHHLEESVWLDAVLGLVTVRYTQSNSVAFVRDGSVVGVGAGQQNRVDCIQLAAGKMRTWWLRRHPFVADLPVVDGQSRQDRLNWQIRVAASEMTAPQMVEFESLFGGESRRRYGDASWREEWVSGLTGVTLTSDGYLPFRDNVEHAAAAGVSVIVEPGGSSRTGEVSECAHRYGITHVQTGLRLFHH